MRLIKTFSGIVAVIFAIAILAATIPATASPNDRPLSLQNLGGKLIGAALGGYAGSHVGDGSGRDVAIGIGSLIGSILGTHTVNSFANPNDNPQHRPLRNLLSLNPRHRQHHHQHQTQPVHPARVTATPIITYQVQQPRTVPDHQLNVTLQRGHPRLPGRQSTLTRCTTMQQGIAAVYACLTTNGDWIVLQ